MSDKVTKYRYFQNQSTQLFFCEKIEWINVGVGDPRAAPIGQLGNNGLDSWVPINISNPGFDMNSVDHTYQTQSGMHSTGNGSMQMVTRRTGVAVFNQMDVYAQPLSPGLIEIDMTTYNNGIDDI